MHDLTKTIILLLLTTIAAQTSIASESTNHEHGTHFECSLPKRPQDILDCAKENHPSVLRKINEEYKKNKRSF